MDPSGNIYKIKRTGPKMDPGGTPRTSGAELELKEPRFTLKNLCGKYDWNHFKAKPLRPTHDSKQENKMWWSIVLKAADRSKSNKEAGLPESTVKIKSLKTFKRAVSVF